MPHGNRPLFEIGPWRSPSTARLDPIRAVPPDGAFIFVAVPTLPGQPPDAGGASFYADRRSAAAVKERDGGIRRDHGAGGRRDGDRPQSGRVVGLARDAIRKHSVACDEPERGTTLEGVVRRELRRRRPGEITRHPRSKTRASTEAGGAVVRVDKPAAIERQAATADAPGEPVLEPLELGDSPVDSRRPRRRQT